MAHTAPVLAFDTKDRAACVRDDGRPDGISAWWPPERRPDDLPRVALRILIRKMIRIAAHGSVVAPMAQWVSDRVLAHKNVEIRQIVRDELTPLEDELWMEAVHYQRDRLAAQDPARRPWWHWRRRVAGLGARR